ncbi:MAG: hypothetical protein QNJ36_10910 [Calothrix sp. MO_167.B42]|nr:hypothetical protein [Calothrix sp. MO_167.B42]
MYYYPPQPPYLLVVFGLFAAFTCGLALTETLKTIVEQWQKDGGENSDSRLLARKSTLPFIGVTLGSGLFLCSGLGVFGFPPLLAYGIGLPITLLTCWLVWSQLGSMLVYVENKGVKSLDLDSLN